MKTIAIHQENVEKENVLPQSTQKIGYKRTKTNKSIKRKWTTKSLKRGYRCSG
jgi:hypothetical protein